MPNDHYPADEPINTQTTEAIPPMEELQPKPVPHTSPVNDEAASAGELESVETRQAEAGTAIFAIGKLNDFLLWLAVVLEITLLLRFFLKLIGANQSNVFAGFLYAFTDILLHPFTGIVGNSFTFEWSTLIGMLVYGLIFYAVRRFLRILITNPSPEE
jgi:uncharacterized protein YggT (Ycf19 family)